MNEFYVIYAISFAGGFTYLGCQVAVAIKFCMVEPGIKVATRFLGNLCIADHFCCLCQPQLLERE